MSVHSDLIEGVAMPLLLDTHGETVIVRLKSGDAPLSLTALVNRERTVQKLTPEGGRVIVKQRRITFTNDSASRFGGIANVPLNATVTVGSGEQAVEYAVAEKPAVLNGNISVIGERSEQKRGGGRDYRKA